jgi:hypothetical protein
LDLSKCSKLNEVKIEVEIDNLSLPEDGALEKIEIGRGVKTIESLNLFKCSKLKEFSVFCLKIGNLLLPEEGALEKIEIDMRENSQSSYWSLHHTDLGSLNLSKYSKLKKLVIEGRIIGNLSLPEERALELIYIGVSGEILKSLDLSKYSKLKELAINGRIDNLSLPEEGALKRIHIGSKARITQPLDLSNCSNLKKLYIDCTLESNLILPSNGNQIRKKGSYFKRKIEQ